MMRHSIVKNCLKVILMLATISKVLGLSTPPEQYPLMPRQVNLSDNIMHFSIPENFSSDMPAEDMIETINLDNKNVYQDYQKFTLIRRWWDFKEGGIFGKAYGSLMMSTYIKEVPDSLEIDNLNPIDFINIIIENIKKERNENPNPLLAFSIYNFLPAYQESWFNQQRWIAYNEEQTEGGQYSFLYAIPVSTRQYIVNEFIIAPNDNVDIVEFIEKFAEPFITRIMESFHIEYQPHNPAGQAVLKTGGPTLEQLINENMRLLEQSDQTN